MTIQPTPGLDPRDRRKANAAGPFANAVRTSYESMLGTAGFTEIRSTDLTSEYRDTQQRWMTATDEHADAIRAAVGEAVFEERLVTRSQTLAAINAGLLSRFMYSARKR